METGNRIGLSLKGNSSNQSRIIVIISKGVLEVKFYQKIQLTQIPGTAIFLKICGYITVLAGYLDILDWKSELP